MLACCLVVWLFGCLVVCSNLQQYCHPTKQQDKQTTKQQDNQTTRQPNNKTTKTTSSVWKTVPCEARVTRDKVSGFVN